MSTISKLVLTVSIVPEETQVTIQTSIPNLKVSDEVGIGERIIELPTEVVVQFLERIENEIQPKNT